MELNSFLKVRALAGGAPGRSVACQNLKKPAEDEGARKRVRRDDDDDEADGGASSASAAPRYRAPQTVDEIVDMAEDMEVPSVDEAGMKKLALQLERAITKNQQLRVKFADQPGRCARRRSTKR